MNIAQIDNISINGQSFFHKSGSLAKMLLSFFLLAALMVTNQREKLVFLCLFLILLLLSSRLKPFLILKLLIYPLFFSLLFVFFTKSFSSYAPLILVLKATTAALTMIWLILTTPYIEVFSLLARVLPSLLADILFFTYRSFFILLEKMEDSLKIIRLRGGYSSANIIKNIKNTGAIIANLFINSFEMSERMYKVYSLRGYSGSLPLGKKKLIKRESDYLLILAGFLVFLGVLLPWTI